MRRSKKRKPDEQVDQDPIAEQAREIADAERIMATQQQAADLTQDYRSVYGRRAFSVFTGY